MTKSIYLFYFLNRCVRGESNDVEEAHSLVEDSETDVEVAEMKKKEFLEPNTEPILKKYFLLSALLDIAGYVIRTMGY